MAELEFELRPCNSRVGALLLLVWDNFRVLVNPDPGRGMGET